MAGPQGEVHEVGCSLRPPLHCWQNSEEHSQLKIELKFQFRNLLPQLSVLHLQKDVLGEDPNECCKCYGDRCTKLQSDQVQYK